MSHADQLHPGIRRPPDPIRPELYADAARLLKDYKDEYFIAGVTVTTIFETAWALRGLETLLMDLVADPDLARTILNIPCRYHRRRRRSS